MITLYTFPKSPNSQKITIYLELLNVPYKLHIIDIFSNEQKSQWFLKLNPNGRVPVLTDTQSTFPRNHASHTNTTNTTNTNATYSIDPRNTTNGRDPTGLTDKTDEKDINNEIKKKDSKEKSITIFETSAILQYLSERYDTFHHFSYSLSQTHESITTITPSLYWDQLNWLLFQSSNHSPIQSQYSFFKRLSQTIPDNIEYKASENEITLNYYKSELIRIFKVYNDHLSKNDHWFIGQELNIVDISVLPWILSAIDSNLIDINQFKHVLKWIDKMQMVEQVRRGLTVK